MSESKGYFNDLRQNLDNLKQADYAPIVKASHELANFANKFDLVVFTGRSRTLTKSLLFGAGLPISKTVSFRGQENAKIYKQLRYRFIAEERALVMEKTLRQKVGDRLNNKPSLCVVDDIIYQGGKADRYLQILKILADKGIVANYAFAALSKYNDEYRHPEFAETLVALESQGKVFTPRFIEAGDGRLVYETVLELSELSSETSFEDKIEVEPEIFISRRLTAPKLQIGKELLQKTLKEIFVELKKPSPGALVSNSVQ